jgi:pilus assembly protein CpaF
MFFVTITEKGGAQQKLEFDEEAITVGRVQGNDVILPRGNVSKRHATVEFKDQRFTMTDLGSTNGTYINGRRLQEPTQIFQGDKIYVGDYILSLDGNPALSREDVLPTEKPDLEVAPEPDIELPLDSVPAPASPEREKVQVPAPRSRSVSQSSTSRPSAPPRAAVPSDDLEEDRVTVEPESPLETIPPDAQAEIEGQPDFSTYVEALLDQIVRQVKRIDKSNLPSRVDKGTAGKVRLVMEELVDESLARGKLPSSVDVGTLKGKVFRSAVYLGPLSEWLDDPSVDMIRINGFESAALLKGGSWIQATGFAGEEDFSEVIGCLQAGLKVGEPSETGITWYRTEEGALVFSSVAADTDTPGALVIDKTATRGSYEALNPKAIETLGEAIDAKSKIAVMGGTSGARLTVIGELFDLLAEDAFVVSVENIPLVAKKKAGCLRLSARQNSGNAKGAGRIGALIPDAQGLESDWLIMSGTQLNDIPRVFVAAASRPGVIAELPLGGCGRIERELSLAMTAAGSTVSTIQSALLLQEAFDIIVVVGRHPNGAVLVKKVLSCAISDAGQWSPGVLFERKSR